MYIQTFHSTILTFIEYNIILDSFFVDCKQPLSLPYLMETETTCIVDDTCTGVRCCVEMSLLDRSFVYSVRLDVCSFMLTVGIEKLTYNQSLIGYKFGKSWKQYCCWLKDKIIYYMTSDNVFSDWLTSLAVFFDKTLYSPHEM